MAKIRAYFFQFTIVIRVGGTSPIPQYFYIVVHALDHARISLILENHVDLDVTIRRG